MSLDLHPAGETTRNLSTIHQPITNRRPQASGEYQIVVPATIGVVDGDLHRSVPYVLPEGWQWDGPRHRRPGLLQRWIGAAW